MFFKLVKASFMQRRKTLMNGLSNSGLVDKQTLKNILKKNGMNEKTRGEDLEMQDFANIANELFELKQ